MENEEDLCYEAKFYARCEYKPFCKTKHKCLRCQECTYIQYIWCETHPRLRKKIDDALKEFLEKINEDSPKL